MLPQTRAIVKIGSLIFFMIIAVACGGESNPSSKATQPEQVIQLNTPFSLKAGQSTVLEAEALKIAFSSVLQDIRCPSKVTCAEKGFARILVTVQLAGQEASSYEMNSEPFYQAKMGLGVNKISHGNYEIQLTGLTPYPEHPDDKLDFGSYEATFVVTKNEE